MNQDQLQNFISKQQSPVADKQLNTPCLPEGFVYLSDVDSTILENLRYQKQDNFVGKPIYGYLSKRAIMTRLAAQALAKVQAKLRKDGYNIVLYDSYRPQKAVKQFVKWTQNPNDVEHKEKYYPFVDKSQLIGRGYLAKQSQHSRGSTVDISIIKIGQKLKPIEYKLRTLKNNQTIFWLDDGTQDFGTSFDYFGLASHPESDLIDKQSIQKRQYLISMMKSQGFKVTDTQWWHYTLQNEPFPNTYFDFDIK